MTVQTDGGRRFVECACAGCAWFNGALAAFRGADVGGYAFEGAGAN